MAGSNGIRSLSPFITFFFSIEIEPGTIVADFKQEKEAPIENETRTPLERWHSQGRRDEASWFFRGRGFLRTVMPIPRR